MNRWIRVGLSCVFLGMACGGAVVGDEPPRPERKVESVLDEWQRRNTARRSVEVKFDLEDVDAFGLATKESGEVILERGGRAKVAARGEDGPGRFNSRTYLWLDRESHLLSESDRFHYVDSNPGQAGADLPDLLAIPFFWDSGRLRLRERYRIDFLGESKGCFLLRFRPARAEGVRSFDEALVLLDEQTYLPRAYRVNQARWGLNLTYRVTESHVDRPIPEDAWKVRDEPGWKLVRLEEQAILRWIVRAHQGRLFPNIAAGTAPQPGP